MIERMRIPKERIPVFIGKDGKTKKSLESSEDVKIDISDDITIQGEALNVMNACNVIKAVGRGFSPEEAFDLLDENITLCVIPLPDDGKILKRVRARIIGTEGKCRKILEMLTKTKISVYGKTASIIGEYEQVEIARDAIEKLIAGARHSNVYKFVEERVSKLE